jgi:hypothetical protein
VVWDIGDPVAGTVLVPFGRPATTVHSQITATTFRSALSAVKDEPRGLPVAANSCRAVT